MPESPESPPIEVAPPASPSEGDQAPAPASEKASTDADEHQKPSLWFFWIVAILSAALDLGSKWWAMKRLTGFDPSTGKPRTITLIAHYADFQYAQNPGGAWSMLRSLPEVGRRPFFLVVSTVASVFIASIYPRIDRRQWAMRVGLPLALGGAIGNLVDRIRHGWVVDFIHVWMKRGPNEYHWPTFNVADVWIVVGVGLMALDVFFSRKLRARMLAREEELHRETAKAEAAASPADPAS